MSRATLKLPVFPERGTGPRKSSPKRKLRATISAPMPAISAQLIDALCSTNDSIRGDAAAQIYNTGVAPALIIAQEWQQNDQLAGLLATPHLHATVGLAVFPDVFAKIRVAMNNPMLANVPPDQDAQEFELHFPSEISLDILTTKDPAGSGAIARYLNKFGQGIQQVEFRCRNVEAATQILKNSFALNAIYPAARPGADNTRMNFFLVAVADVSGKQKILIELYDQPCSADACP